MLLLAKKGAALAEPAKPMVAVMAARAAMAKVFFIDLVLKLRNVMSFLWEQIVRPALRPS